MWKHACVGAALTLLAAGAEAADGQGRSAVHGIGGLKCQRFIELCSGQDDQCAQVVERISYWVSGYVTAANAASKNTYDLLPWQQPEVVADAAYSRCRARPDASLASAIAEVVGIFSQQRIQTAQDRVEIGEGQRKVRLYRETVRQMQEGLIRGGYLKGKADGVYGPGTKAALEAFQKAQNIEVTSLPDQRTLVQLFYIVPEQARQGAQRGSAAPQGRQGPAAPPPSSPEPRMDLRLQPSPQ